MIRNTAIDARVPFLNIVQACTWAPSAMRVPGPDEMRFLVYSTLAYGGQGVSYFVYCTSGITGGIAMPDGKPTPLYDALKSINREFVAIAKSPPLRSLAVYHAGMSPPGSTLLPEKAAFRSIRPLRPWPTTRRSTSAAFCSATSPTAEAERCRGRQPGLQGRSEGFLDQVRANWNRLMQAPANGRRRAIGRSFGWRRGAQARAGYGDEETVARLDCEVDLVVNKARRGREAVGLA